MSISLTIPITWQDAAYDNSFEVKNEVKQENVKKEEDTPVKFELYGDHIKQEVKVEELVKEEAELSNNHGLEPALMQIAVLETKAEATSPSDAPKDAKNNNSTKNIVKNYGRAMVIFAISAISKPYINGKLKELKLEMRDFRKYLNLRKHNIDGISSLRAMLLITNEDTQKIKSIKKIFQYSCEVFIKYFSINWIYYSRLGDKREYLMARFKMLRRVRHPEAFTYFK